MKVFFSNRYEVLADRLRDELFFKNREPFAKRWIIVPSQTVKNDLLYRWAQDPLLEVATGVLVMTLGQALHRLFPHVPSMMELSLKIEANLEKTGAIQSYLQGGGTKRLTGLCDQLSALFLKQGTFRGKPFDEPWLQALWEKVALSWESSANVHASIYLFNLSFLPQRYLEYFKQNAQAGFFASPTALYWGDVSTPREQQFLLDKASDNQKTDLEGYFQDQNRLIAHLGKMGRKMWMELQEGAEECYVEPEGFALQRQMMHLEAMEVDGSIEVHAAPSKAREVEIVWEILQRLEAAYDEVMVVAPDIAEYVPYIHKVFQGEGYAISGLEMRLEHVEHLFKIPQLKFGIDAVLKLFSYKPFLEKFGFSKEDAVLIKKWTEQANFHVGDWDEGFGRMMKALASIPEEGDPLIEFSQTEALGKWIEVLQLLKKELGPIEKNSEMRADEWIDYFQKVVHQFFAIETEEQFFSELRRYAGVNAATFSFESFQRVLEEIFGKKTGVFQAGNLNALRFASLASGSIIPARVYIVMGMEEGKFPRVEKKKPLSEIEGDYCPTASQEDRYLFLEVILAVREKLILTYPSIDPEDGKEMRPSLLIEELFSEVAICRHPRLPFDQIYFQQKGLRSSSKFYSRAAQSYYNQEKGIAKPLIAVSAELKRKEEEVIDIRHLKKLARHPVEFFLQRKCGVYFEREKKNDKEFVLSHLDLAYFRRASLEKELSEILEAAEVKGKLPVGPFRSVAVRRIEEEIEEYHAALSTLGIRKEEIFSVEFKASCDSPVQMRDGEWIVPPLQCGSMQIVGRLDDLCPQGLLFHGEAKLEDWLKAWPLYLIALNLPVPIQTNLLLTKKGVKKENVFQDPKEALSRFVDYYLAASENLSILMPKWGKSILEKGVVEPDEGNDEILDWFLQRDSMEWAGEWLKVWSPMLKEVYREAL